MKVSSKKLKKNLMYTWGVSYVSVIAIMLVATIIISLLYTSTSKRISKKFNEYIFSNVTSDVNETLISMNNLYMTLIQNPDILNIFSDDSIKSYNASHNLALDLKSYVDAYKNIDNVFIYIKESNSVISRSGHIPSELFFSLYFNSEQISYEEWQSALINHDDNITYTSMPYKSDINKDTSVIAMIFNIPKTKKDCVGLVLSNQNNFLKELEKLNLDFLCDIYIYNKYGNLTLYSKQSKDKIIPRTLSDVYEMKKGEITINESDIVVNGYAWKVVAVTSDGFVGSALVVTQIAIIAILLISLAILFFVVNKIVRRNYMPIRKMLSFFGIKESFNEYETLYESISTTLDKNTTLSKKIDNYEENLKKIHLSRLLRGDLYYTSENSFGFEFLYDHFAVITFDFNDFDNFSKEKKMPDSEKLFYLSFIINNVLSELMLEKNIVLYTTEIDGQVVCLTNFGESIRDIDIKSTTDTACDFINKNFDVFLSYALSSICNNRLDISLAYSQALEVLDHKRMFGIREPMQYIYTHTNLSKNKNFFNVHEESMLINALKIGDETTALTIINQIFDELRNNKEVPLNYIKYIVLDVASTITKTGNEIIMNGIELDDILSFHKKIQDSKNLEAMSSQMQEYIIYLCNNIKNDLSNEKNRINFLISHIEKYINENYTDTDLNVNSIGQYFNITPHYISTTFKKETGVSILTYINNIRIGRAKALIKEGKYSKSTISKMVGFSTERTFYRILKKYEENNS